MIGRIGFLRGRSSEMLDLDEIEKHGVKIHGRAQLGKTPTFHLQLS